MDWSRVIWRKASYSGSNGGDCVEVGVWRKASYSGNNGGDCIEVGLWRKASYSGNDGGACIEASRLGPLVGVRDSKHPDGPKLAFTPRDWTTFTSNIKSGRYDRP